MVGLYPTKGLQSLQNRVSLRCPDHSPTYRSVASLSTFTRRTTNGSSAATESDGRWRSGISFTVRSTVGSKPRSNSNMANNLDYMASEIDRIWRMPKEELEFLLPKDVELVVKYYLTMMNKIGDKKVKKATGDDLKLEDILDTPPEKQYQIQRRKFT
jgi:hypothetical protein